MHNILYKKIIQNLPYGYSCHKIVENDSISYDFEFVDINKSYEEYTGLNSDQIVGKTISSLNPRIYGQVLNWADLFNKVKTGSVIDTELFAESRNQYYKITISLEDEYIITHVVPQHKGNCPFTEHQCFIRMNIIPIMMIDALGKIYRSNKLWTQQFGVDYLDKSKLFIDFVHLEDRKNVEEKLESVKDSGYIQVECKLICDNNEYKEIALYIHKRGKYIYLLAREISKEKKLERQLKSSKENFEAFFMAIDDLAFVGDYNGNVLYANNAVQKKLGYTLQETRNMNVLDFHPEEVRQEAIEILDDMFNKKRDTCPLPVARKDGSLIPVETRAWFGKWDNKDCIFTLSKDLSKEQESMQILLRIFKEFPANVIIRELPSYKYVDANKNFIRNFGYTEKELLEKAPSELQLFSNEEDFLNMREELSISGFINTRLMKFKTKTGTIINGMHSGTVIESQGKKYLLAFIIDVSKQMEYEKELEHKGRLQQLLVGLSSKFINHTFENFDEDINKSLEELGRFVGADRAYIFDYDYEKNTTSNTYEWCSEGISPEIHNLQDGPIDAFPDWFEPHSKGETIYIPDVLALDGNVYKIKEYLIPQNIKSLITIPMMKGDRCIGFVGFDSVTDYRSYTQDEIELLMVFAQILVNLHMRKNQEDMLNESRLKAQQASQVKSNFIAQIGHEIRTPLNGALGFLQLLYESATMTRQFDYINKAKTSMNILLKLVDDMKDISRIEANKLEIKNAPFDIRNVINESITPFVFDMNKKGIGLYINVDADVPVNLSGDSDRIKQIITNLVNNSIKHTDKGTIHISCSVEREMPEKVQLMFLVKDTGEGILKENLPYIFEPFFQGTINYSYQGMGLGLAICKELVSKMDGGIWVESELGKGTAFYFTITLGLDLGQFNMVNKSTDSRIGKISGVRVLLAEDNEINKELAKEILNSREIEVNTVDNGAQALEALNKNEYDIVLMDIQMPVMDGLEATKRIREGNVKPNIPIIAMTAAVMEEDRELIMSSGFNGIVEKPLFVDLLIKEIYSWTIGENAPKELAAVTGENTNSDSHENIFNDKKVMIFKEELSKYLIENNVDALELIKVAEQKKLFPDSNFQIKLIESHIKNYDFQSALEELNRLCK